MQTQLTKCRAITSIGDDQGDNSCTFHCQLESGHEGLHCEKFILNNKNLTMTWDGSEKIEVEKYRFKLKRTLFTMLDNSDTSMVTEDLITELVSVAEVYRNYSDNLEGTDSSFWLIDSLEPIEETKVIELIYEDTLND